MMVNYLCIYIVISSYKGLYVYYIKKNVVAKYSTKYVFICTYIYRLLENLNI